VTALAHVPARVAHPVGGAPAAPRAAVADPADRCRLYPKLRFMGSKHRLLPWLHEILSDLPFESALDAFSGSGCVSYLLKTMGKRVVSNDFLRFPATIARATIENDRVVVDRGTLSRFLKTPSRYDHFIAETFRGIFFTPEDLEFLDRVWANLRGERNRQLKSMALAALIRACVKRQPRGVFTVAGDPDRYKDGRRDLRLTIEQHFHEQVEAYNACVFDNGRRHTVLTGDAFAVEPGGLDLVYLDPPYVPRADDNCYVKRYHFLEGLACYWEGLSVLRHTRVRKIAKPFTPFSYRRTAVAAFDGLFERFRKSILVLSYSSNGFPDLDVLRQLMKRHKARVEVHERAHRYHFGTHDRVRRALAREYLVVGR
jgi:DNA adenine methylase/adenine-specific DNA-methyltransferase